MYVISFEAVHDEGALRDRIREWLMRFRQALKTGIDEGQQDGSVSAQVEADDLSREILTSGSATPIGGSSFRTTSISPQRWPAGESASRGPSDQLNSGALSQESW